MSQASDGMPSVGEVFGASKAKAKASYPRQYTRKDWERSIECACGQSFPMLGHGLGWWYWSDRHYHQAIRQCRSCARRMAESKGMRLSEPEFRYVQERMRGQA